MSILILGALALLYIVPSVVAASREHHNAGAIVALNILLGWLLIPWVIALVWGLTEVRRRAPAEPAPVPVAAPDAPYAAGAARSGDSERGPAVGFIFLLLLVVLVIGMIALNSPTRESAARLEAPREWRVSRWASDSGFENTSVNISALRDHERTSGGRYAPRLQVACVNDVTRVSILFGDEKVGADALVTLRAPASIDQAAWSLSDDGRSIGLWSGREAIPTARWLVANDGATITVDVPGQATERYTLRGAREAIATVATACGWDLDG